MMHCAGRLFRIALALVPGLGAGLILDRPVWAESDGGLPPAQRIINGEPVVPGEAPWQAGLLRDGSFICGGSVIGPRLVLTAAHCVVDGRGGALAASHFAVFTGSVTRTEGGTRTAVDRVTLHQHYDPRPESGIRNDIALLHLREPVAVAPVALPAAEGDTGLTTPGQPVTVSGWGLTESNGDRPSARLMKVTVPVVAPADCTRAYGGVIGATQLCAGLTGGGKDSCQGDSGGPLVAAGAGGQPVQVGVVSWGKGCARAGLPGVYTRVASFLPWLRCHGGSDDERAACPQEDAVAPTPHPPRPPAAELRLEMHPGPRVALTHVMSLRITPGWAGHLVVLDINAQGQVVKIYPNSLDPAATGAVRSGVTVTIPAPDSGVVFRAEPPTGQGAIVGVLIADPRTLASVESRTRALERLPGGTAVAAAVAELRTVLERSRGRWSLQQLDYTIVP